jgi:YcxB-like protein
MTIHFTYDKKQVLQALRYHFVTRKEIRILLILVNVFAIVSAALFFMKKISPLAFLVSSILWISLMVVFWFLLPNTIYKRAATFRDSLQIMFSENEIRIENDRGYKEWKWTDFGSYLESPNFFHLYLNSRSFFLIPKEACETDADLAQLRGLLKEHIRKG